MPTASNHFLGLRCAFVLALGLFAACTGEISDPQMARINPFAMGPFAGAGGTGGAGGAAGGPGIIPSTCVAGQLACGGVCVDVAANPVNCGNCGVVCPAGSACVAGSCGCPPGQALCNGVCGDPLACSCPPGWQLCNGVCADVQTNAASCGACGVACGVGQVCDAGTCRAENSDACTTACGGGRTCQAGTCVCPPNQTFCAGVCVDVQTSDAHCGACDAACQGGMVCGAGSCACAAPQIDCGGECTDVQTSLQHCGTCDHACTAGDACTAGRCAGPTGDDGCAGEALGVTIAQVAAYQSIKIPIAEDQLAIASGQRVADVIQGRETLVRIFVNVDAGFTARELSARLTLINAADEQVYFAKQTIRARSTDSDAASTFQLFLPADQIADGTRYAVEVVECTASAAGSVRAPRFPATGDAALEARPTGALRIAIVPMQVNGFSPDTSEAALSVYRDYLQAMYPASAIELTVIAPITTPSPLDWGSALEQVRRQRESDRPASNVYYYGFLKPAASAREFCGRGCTAGIGYVGDERSAGARVAVGLAFGDESSAEIMAHEVGHNHGRNHAPCAPGGQIEGVDSQYPHDGAVIGVWGYDNRSRELLPPEEATDIMGYCDQQWVSDYTYRGLTDRIATLNGLPLRIITPELIDQWQVMLIGAGGPRWSLPFIEPAEAYGEPELAEIFGAQGQLIEYATVYRTEISDGGGAIVLVPPAQADWQFVGVQGMPPLSFSEPSSVPEP